MLIGSYEVYPSRFFTISATWKVQQNIWLIKQVTSKEIIKEENINQSK